MTLVQAIVIECKDAPLVMQQRIEALGPYRGRGKGGKHPARRAGVQSTKQHQRAALKKRNQQRNRIAHRG